MKYVIERDEEGRFCVQVFSKGAVSTKIYCANSEALYDLIMMLEGSGLCLNENC